MAIRHWIASCLLLASAFVYAASEPKPLVYNGETLPQSGLFKRKWCGEIKTSVVLSEVSGIACSRVTPGYIWMQSDDYESLIIATNELAQKIFMQVNFDKKIRWDWEDMSGGMYEGKHYLFIGAFGDNDEDDGKYSIVYFEEPEITPSSPSTTVTPSQIRFQYPGGKKHNAEALMYDNVEQVIYVITKVYYDVCQVFSLPFRLDYGDEEQELTYVCDLGVRSDLGTDAKPSKGFHLVTAADISPDGKYILIKNHNNILAAYSWILYWEREGNESVAETVKRQPVVLNCYQYEWQGEAICWLDDDTFYTTSDADSGNPPVYKYTRVKNEGLENLQAGSKVSKQLIGDQLYIRTDKGLYTLDGRFVH